MELVGVLYCIIGGRPITKTDYLVLLLSIVLCATGRRSASPDLLRGNTHLQIRYLSRMNNEETVDHCIGSAQFI